MTDENKLSTFAKDIRTQAGAIALIVSAASVYVAAPSAESSSSDSARLSPSVAATATTSGKRTRLDVASTGDVQPGASLTAQGTLSIGSRLAPIDGCIGQYNDATRVCVLSPGAWEVHSSCAEEALAPQTTCTIVVRNTGSIALAFAGYVIAEGPSVESSP